MIDFFSEVKYYDAMSGRITDLLAQAQAWCRHEKGRQSRLARVLGVSRQTVSVWFKEYTKARPSRQPTAEQTLALQAFLEAVGERYENKRR
jgi:transposase-like protein